MDQSAGAQIPNSPLQDVSIPAMQANGAIPSVYQPTQANLNAADPATAPGGPFYDPYPTAAPGQAITNDPWKADFPQTPAAGKERLDAFPRITESEKHPIVEIPTTIEKKEVDKIGEAGIEVEEKEHARLEQPVRDGLMREPLVMAPEHEVASIEVPVSHAQFVAGAKVSPDFSLRWIVTLVNLLFKKGYRIVFKD